MNRPIVPAADPWTLAVHCGETGFEPVGTAVAISARVALTCAHVVLDGSGKPGGGRLIGPLWVSFPKVTSAWKIRRLVTRVEYDTDDPQIADVAVLYLAEDMPAAVEPARLRLLEPEVLAGRQGRPGQRWWAFGFPASSGRNGNEASGTVGARLAHGWVRLDTESPYPVEKGFSGGGLWVPEYQAVAGIVGRATPEDQPRGGDLQALTLAHAAVFLPSAKLQVLAGWAAADAGPAAMAAWGWVLETDPEAGRHWQPRGRGVMSDLEAGHRFHGRRAALTQIVGWLDRPEPDRRVLVVTGSPGVGKSAVLGRVVTTADQRLRQKLPAGDTGVVATVGSVGCAVHVKGKTALDVAAEIAQAVGVALPERIEDLVAAVQVVLAARPARFNVVIDAVDEAVSVEDARAVLTGVVLPLVQVCGELGVQVVCGSRRHDAAGHLLGVLAGAAVEVDLDEPEFFELADLEAYTAATLRLVGSERSDSPYADPVIGVPVAARIAALAEPNFLVAGLDARRRGMYDTVAADPATLALTATVDAALDAYLNRIAPVGGVDARTVLTGLAYAEAPGWSSEVWQEVTAALGSPVGDVHLDQFARSAAADFLIETSTATGESVFRLFHQALNDALRRGRSTGGVRADERRLTRALYALGRDRGWALAPAYLVQSLSGHADRAELIDEVLIDDDYLLHADLLRLLPAANRARTDAGRDRTRMLSLTPQAITAPARERTAMFSVTQALERLSPLTSTVPGPYRARWASARQRTELRRFDGHIGWVSAVCAVTVDGRTLLASAGHDETVRLWDAATGVQHRRLDGHTAWVRAVCAVTVDGRTLLATASADYDGTLWLWDPTTGEQHRRFDGHTGGVSAVCAVTVDGRSLLASAGYDGTVRLWDPTTGEEQVRFDGHIGWVSAVCAVPADGRSLLASASAGDDGTVWLWDPTTGEQRGRFVGHTGGVSAVCAVTVDGRTLLATASAGNDGTVWLWDPATGVQQCRLDGHAGWVSAVCAVPADGRSLLATASASYDGTVWLWDPTTGEQHGRLDGHTDGVSAVCAVTLDGRTLLASASHDETLRMWDPAARAQLRRPDGHARGVSAVCAVAVDDRTVIATVGYGYDKTVWLWDAATGEQHGRLDGHTDGVSAVCAVALDGRTLLASAGHDGTVWLWDPATGEQHGRFDCRPDGRARGVSAVCAVTLNGRTLLATAGYGGTVWLWDPATGEQRGRFDGHTGRVSAVCAVTLDGRTLLASAGHDGTVSLWDPATGNQHGRFDGHTRGVSAVCAVTLDGRTLLASASAGAGYDGTVRLWDPATGKQHRRFDGHTRGVSAVCAVTVDGRTLLASAGHDRTVRLWDPATGRCLWSIPVQHRVSACATIGRGIAMAMDVGLMVIDIQG